MELINKLKGNLAEYTSMPFWSWNNELEPDELVRQIHEFKEQSIDGFIMHARTGLKTEYLGDKWFECVGVCLKEAKKLGMRAWVYDENGWPSGFVGGKLLDDPDNLVRKIEYQIKDFYDTDADYVYSLVGGKAKKLTKGEFAEKYHCLYISADESYADIMNAAVTDKFIAATHEEYYKRFKDSFGKELIGFFTDEPQYYRWGVPYSIVAETEFKKAYGEDITEGLLYLFTVGDEANVFRTKYYGMLNNLIVKNFYAKLYDWCEKHGCKLTGHTVEETSLAFQMWGCAGAMPTYEYEHIPGIDWLGRDVGNPISPKQVGSMAQQLGKKQVLTETFGCSGWDTTPRQLRRIAEFQYVNGVNTMCQHLCSYSLKGQAKGDYPPSFSRHNPWINKSKPFNEYFKRLSYILCNTKERANVLIVHPMRSAYLTYDRVADSKSVEKLDKDFEALCKMLSSKGVQYHFGDETVIARYGKIENGKFTVGECAYDYVIIPAMDSLTASAFSLADEFARAGGKVVLYGSAPALTDGKKTDKRLKATAAMDDIPVIDWLEINVKDGLYVTHRIGDDGEFIYIVNPSEENSAKAVCKRGCIVVDLNNAEYKNTDGIITIEPSSSVMLKIDDNIKLLPEEKKMSPKNVTDKFSFVSADENNLTIDFLSVSEDGKKYGKPVYCECANEFLIKKEFSGKLWIKYSFDVKDIPLHAKLLLERLDYYSVELNGKTLDIKDTEFDVMFGECDISETIIKGKNELVCVLNYYQNPTVKNVLFNPNVKESLKNCLIIDTEIQSVYIKGDFCVDGKRNIVASKSVSGTNDLQKKGYPNFGGKAVLRGRVAADGRKSIRVTGKYMIADIKINGKSAVSLVTDETADIGKYLTEEENDIEITLTPSLRNLMGPHHFKPEPEPHGVGHYHFDFRGSWNDDGTSECFSPEYFLVPFGIEKIEMF